MIRVGAEAEKNTKNATILIKSMGKEEAIVIKDSENIQNIFIQINLKNKTTSVFSNFSAWENLALIMEALAITVQKCIREGMSRKKVYSAIKNYLIKVLGNYVIIDASNKSPDKH